MVEAAAAALAVEAYRDGRNLISYVTKKLDYADDLEKNYKRLTEEADKLFARRADVEAQVRKDMMKRITKECDAWISRVRVIEQEVLELENEFKKGTKRTWRKRRILSRSTLSRRMANKCEELHSLWAEGRVETDVVVEKPPEPVRVINSPRTENKPSLHWAIEEIRGHLRDRNVKRIGLWGTLGIGKTTIMHNLNNDEEIANMFDIVISVSVSEDNSIEKLQRAILRRLKLNVEGNNDQSEVAWRISKELENKRYLFLLDEVSETLELHRVGIPEDEMDSKVVLASRYEHVCYDMEVDEFVNVKRLSDFDAWKMFREKVGRNINLPGVEEIARLVVNECAGLPLLIDRVARNFRKKDNINLWRDGLRSLRRWPDIKVQGMEEVLEFLKFCYDDLDDETQKISRDRGHSILSDLLDVSLLERSKKMKHVRMNKVIRNMALKISSDSKDSTFLVKAREGLQEPPTEEEWKGVSGISLMDNKLHSLPEAVDCEDLRTLLLQRNHELTLIPESFFQSMPKLQVLDLHGCGCRSLPSSISSLTSLTALYLNSCRDLMELPADMKALRKLEVLDIRGSGINYLPVQIGHLLQLRCLRISLSNSCIGSLIQGQSRFAQISQNIISRLRWLEELTIDVDPHNQWWDGVVKTITKEVATLTRLTSLSFCFPSVDYGEGVDHAIKKVLAEADAFELIRHKGISSISEFGIESINKMRGCLIEGCTDIEFIIDGTHATEPSLGCLEKMVIKNAPRLASIFAGPVHSGSLGRLTTLSIYKCPKLLMIFSCGVIQQLSELQHLRVEECHEIREIIMRVENSILEPGSLPKLKTLILIDLPKLRSIWVDNSLEWASLEGITVYMCQSLIRLPFGKSNASNLRYIKGQRMWWRMLEWEEDGTEGRLQSLCIFSQ
ncbi:hypothetical protein CRG98_004672 [Punica granatum]|uniref:Uncharacterized protein n=1 Tax=Punica granatum TaxID=22663 RepID=A0A2I0L2S8_PUNGR|nr:hypothetical protein CRG98_004672 [Punica granatum]